MNGSNKREYKDGIYVAPNGRKYRISGASSQALPQFALNEDGVLVYKYSSGQEEHEFTVTEEGMLASDLENLYINADGFLEGNMAWSEILPDVSDETMAKNIRLLRQHNKRIRLKVTLLDDNYQEVESITGKIKGAPSYDIDADSDIRRTCSLTLSIPSKEQIQLDFEKTWNNRMVELSCGIYSWEDKEYVWYDLGRMLMVNGSTVYNATTQEVKLNLVDLMAALTQERGSQIGVETKVPAESDVDGAIISVITTFSPFKLCEVDLFDDSIPYDLISNIGAYPIDILNSIMNLFPYYECFYDVNGKFITRQIPTKIDDPVDIGEDILDDLIISEKRDIDFSVIKNTTELYGQKLTAEYTALDCETEDGCYNITISDSYLTPVAGETFAVLPDVTSIAGQTMNIQDTGEYPIVTTSTVGGEISYLPIAAGQMKAGVPYVLRFFENKYIYQGEMIIRVIIQEVNEEPSQETKDMYMAENDCEEVQWIVNPDSPFACSINPVTHMIQGEKKQVLEGGEYSAIYSTQLAYERASYENWKACRMQDTIEVEMILVPWMDVNDKIQYTSPVSGDVGTWLVKGISYNFNDWTMTVKASRFYPYYPFWE